MNKNIEAFIDLSRRTASENSIPWDIEADSSGKVRKHARWSLSAICGLPSPPSYSLSDLGDDSAALDHLSVHRGLTGDTSASKARLPRNWEELYKATIIHELLIKGNKPVHSLNNVGRPLRIIATCARQMNPGDLDGEAVRLAYNIALKIGKSGAVAINLAMVIRNIFDKHQLSTNCPLAQFCIPFDDEAHLECELVAENLRYYNNNYRSVSPERKDLMGRRASEKLPDADAFRELVSVIFTKHAKTLSDAIKFKALAIEVATGLRVGELANIPLSWRATKSYFDHEGRSAEKSGGIKESLAIRHFAEKQANEGLPSKVALYEAIQHVPEMLEPLVADAISDLERLTAPMRAQLKLQSESGRLFPDFKPGTLIPSWELYRRLTGATQISCEPIDEDLANHYRSTYSLDTLRQIRDQQTKDVENYGTHQNIRKYFDKSRLVLRNENGKIAPTWNQHFAELWIRVDEAEGFAREHLPTKLPDLEPFQLHNGSKLYPHDLLMLLPIRPLIEQRNSGILDIERYYSAGRLRPADIQTFVAAGKKSLFAKYSDLDTREEIGLNVHSLRHLQTGELFRLGVAESIISKRFNRKSVKQSHAYNHASLSEELESMQIDKAGIAMPRSSLQVLKMINAGMIRGSIVDEFKLIQKSDGDDAALSFLSAEADGLHVTPYGFCINSFVVDPCPKHLECYNGCRHLSRTSIESETESLLKIKGRMTSVVEAINETPLEARSAGWKNQLTHATERLSNIERALSTQPGERPFPEGKDHYVTTSDRETTTILDIKANIWRPDA